MITIALEAPDDFEEWRNKARDLIQQSVPPHSVTWSDAEGTADLFAMATPPKPLGALSRMVRANRKFLAMASSCILHKDPQRFGLLYRLLWRLQSQPHLMDDAADQDVFTARRMQQHIRRDIHKMRAFVRFRTVREDGGERFIAWYEPDHHIERVNANFFLNRFASQKWSILTPRLSLHWDGQILTEGPPASRLDVPSEDATEDLWLGYYRSTFNPARLKVGMMVKEMPRRFWKNLPEAQIIPDLIAGAQAREAAMIAVGSTAFTDTRPTSFSEIAEGIQQCSRCPIGCNGTRAVAGEGPPQAHIMIVGEQPGDKEEASGRPFIGPAGQVLNAALEETGIDRDAAYVTNAVKHFKFEQTPERRLHRTPTASEIDTCRWWLDSEIEILKPKFILALGANSARSLLGRTPSIAKERGKAIYLDDGTLIWLTAHPSYLLRLDGEAKEREHLKFKEDIAEFAKLTMR